MKDSVEILKLQIMSGWNLLLCISLHSC